MDDEAEASREYERLRAELADFVLDALAERIAAGQEPRLSKAMIDAIDKRVDASVQERLTRHAWPDPNDFADAVIAAAGGNAGSGDRLATTSGRTRPAESKGKGGGAARGSIANVGRLTNLQIGLLVAIGIAIVAVVTIIILRSMGAPAPAVTNAVSPVDIVDPAGRPENLSSNNVTGGNGVAGAAGETR